MRNISFMLTTDQVRRRIKTVTRRLGWLQLKPGSLLCGVEKGMGLKRGETVNRLSVIRVTDVRREPLARIIEDPEYGRQECILEGFGEHPQLNDPAEFARFFCNSHRGCKLDSLVTRIEYEYVDTPLP